VESIKALKNASATRWVASSIGALTGFASMEHGFFEVLQGSVRPSGIRIEAIGPAQRFWEHGTELALTIIPNFLVTGILAVIVGLLVIVWSVAFIDGEYGARVLVLLSIAMFLFGGGFAPPLCATLAIVAAAGIDRPLTWWRNHLSLKARDSLAVLWPCSLIAFVLLFLLSVAVAISGYPLMWFLSADDTLNLLSALGYITFFGLGPVVLLAALAHDIGSEQTARNTVRNPGED
jgi:hypothetical protein